jgi:hypothetical protein
MLTKLKEDLKSYQKELDASKQVSKKLMSEKNLLDQKVQRLERMKNEEVIFIVLLLCYLCFFCSDFTVKSLFISYFWNMVYMIMQKSTMEKVYADECRKLKSQIAELEQKLEDATRSLNVAESNLAVRNAEVDSLQNSLKDLDELREFKAVRGVQ